MANRWIEFVKKYANENNISYTCAMCEIKTKGLYKPLNKQETKEDIKTIKIKQQKPKLNIDKEEEDIFKEVNKNFNELKEVIKMKASNMTPKEVRKQDYSKIIKHLYYNRPMNIIYSNKYSKKGYFLVENFFLKEMLIENIPKILDESFKIGESPIEFNIDKKSRLKVPKYYNLEELPPLVGFGQ
jgi:hypothetical protein